MSTAKTGRKAIQAPTPAHAPARVAMAREMASAAPSQQHDPGPPPAMPQPTSSTTVMRRLAEAGATREREHVLSISTMRETPEASRYKAEVLDWMDRIDAYEAATR